RQTLRGRRPVISWRRLPILQGAILPDPDCLSGDRSALPAIVLVDVRDGGPLQHARERAGAARALRDDCLAWFPAAAAPLVPLMARLARRWLMRSHSPYVAEIDAIAAALGFPGV